jgi:hypothetical protein
VTLASVGVVAAVLADLVHEVAGHLLAGLLAGDHIRRLSSVGLQTVGPIDRLLSAAGTCANLLVGAVSAISLARPRGAHTGTWSHFLLLFAAFNLFNSGYLVSSGISQRGDWAVIISQASPPWLWRTLLILIGVGLYWVTTVWLGWQLECRFGGAGISRGQWCKLLLGPYLAATAVMVTASAFNPYGAYLILVSGFAASAVLSSGLLAAGAHIPVSRVRASTAVHAVRVAWLLAALIVGGLFIAVLGRGICLDCTMTRR